MAPEDDFDSQAFQRITEDFLSHRCHGLDGTSDNSNAEEEDGEGRVDAVIDDAKVAAETRASRGSTAPALATPQSRKNERGRRVQSPVQTHIGAIEVAEDSLATSDTRTTKCDVTRALSGPEQITEIHSRSSASVSHRCRPSPELDDSGRLLQSKHPLAPMADALESTEPDDTQYIPSQEFNARVKGTSASHYPLTLGEGSHVADDTSLSLPKTYRTGDTGHIDLALDLASNGAPDFETNGNDKKEEDSEDELAISQRQAEEDAVTSPIPLSPITPAIAGQKRDRNGDAVNRFTPVAGESLAAMFKAPAMKGAIGLSQIFKQTQAATSPFPDGPRSDPIFERPSPEFQDAYNRTSPFSSSPVLTRHQQVQRATTDPREMYVSMKDSQEVRDKQQTYGPQNGLDPLSDPNGDEDELGEDSIERRAKKKRRRAQLEAGARKEFEILARSSAPDRLDRRSKVTRKSKALATPAPQTKSDGVICISDDTPQPRPLEDAEYEVSDDGSMDVYDELSQTIFSSTRRRSLNDRNEQFQDSPARPTSSPLPSNHDKAVKDTRLTQKFDGSIRDERYTPHGADDNSSSVQFGPSQIIKVADSQPNKVDEQDDMQHAEDEAVLPSSVNSRNFVSQSQGLSHSISATTELPLEAAKPNSSSVPRAPLAPFTSEPDDHEEATVSESPPSSPPPSHSKATESSTRAADESTRSPGKDAGRFFDNVEDKDDKMTGSPKGISSPSESSHSQIFKERRREEKPVRVIRRPIRTIADTSPASASSNPSPRKESKSSPVKSSARASFSLRDRAPRGTDRRSESQAISRSTSLFDTAQTHQPLSPTRDAEPSEPQTHDSPKLSVIKKFKSIGHSQTHPSQSSSFETNFDILNEADHNYEMVMQHPPQDERSPRKRGSKSYLNRRALQEPAPEANVLPPCAAEPRFNVDVAQRQPTLDVILEQPRFQDSRPPMKGRLKRPASSTRRRLGKLVDPVASEVTKAASERDRESSIEALSPALVDGRDELGDTNERNEMTEVPLEPRDNKDLANPTIQEVGPVTEVNDLEKGNRLFPNRVFARFKDPKNFYWPATCVDRRGANGPFTIKFDDGNIDEDVSPNFVRLLELRPGDIVKVDRDTMRNKLFVVRGMVNCSTNNVDHSVPADAFGHQAVSVQVKQRSSVSGNGDIAEAESVEVQISEIYLTSSLWPQFVNRFYDFDPNRDPHDPLRTPIEAHSRAGTPSSRSRRHTLALPKKSAPFESVPAVEPKSGLFSNMVFAISYKVKAPISKTITDNGGRLLSDSFEELFDRSSWLPTEGQEVNLKLSPAAMNLGFAALITEKHSRRVKYFQALALNIPCLSGKWIVDCVAKRTILPWVQYLLPAGESKLLGGAARSRTFVEASMPPSDASSATLKGMIESRPSLLQGSSVVTVMEKKGRGHAVARERRQLHVFLSCALGAGKVARVENLTSAKDLLEQERETWDWLSVEDDSVEEARQVLSEVTADSPRTSRKKRRMTGNAVQGPQDGNLRSVRVVGEEFVVQSLIAGALMGDF